MLCDLESELETKKQFKGYKTWLKELSELEEVVKLGMKLGWDYCKNESRFR